MTAVTPPISCLHLLLPYQAGEVLEGAWPHPLKMTLLWNQVYMLISAQNIFPSLSFFILFHSQVISSSLVTPTCLKFMLFFIWQLTERLSETQVPFPFQHGVWKYESLSLCRPAGETSSDDGVKKLPPCCGKKRCSSHHSSSSTGAQYGAGQSTGLSHPPTGHPNFTLSLRRR